MEKLKEFSNLRKKVNHRITDHKDFINFMVESGIFKKMGWPDYDNIYTWWRYRLIYCIEEYENYFRIRFHICYQSLVLEWDFAYNYAEDKFENISSKEIDESSVIVEY